MMAAGLDSSGETPHPGVDRRPPVRALQPRDALVEQRIICTGGPAQVDDFLVLRHVID